MNNCEAILMYINDIIDGTAEEDVQKSFFEHTKRCEQCRRKYEISMRIRDILSSRACGPDDEFSTDVMKEVRGVSRHSRVSDPSKERYSLRNLAICTSAIIIAGLSVFFMFIFSEPRTQTNPNDAVASQPDANIIASENAIDYFSSDFFGEWFEAGEGSITVSSVCNLLRAHGFNIGSDSYGYIVTAKISDADIISRNYEMVYIDHSNKDSYAFFYTTINLTEALASLSDAEELCAVSGRDSNTVGLIVAKVVS